MSRYAQLFDVKIEHAYHLNFGGTPHAALNDDVRDYLARLYSSKKTFSIFPSAETVKTLSGYRMIFKETNTGFIVAVETGDANQPKVSLDARFLLRFGFSLKDKAFANYTALPRRNDGLFSFSNNSGNTAADNYLSRPVADFNPSKVYEAGELYLRSVPPDDGLFQAVRDTGPAVSPIVGDWVEIPSDTYDATETYTAGDIVLQDYSVYRALVNGPGVDLSNVSDWELIRLLANQYVTDDDYFTLYGERLNLDISSAAISEASIFVYRVDTSEEIHQAQFIAESGTLGMLPLELVNLPAGVYRLEVRDSTDSVLSELDQEFYLDPEAINKDWFATIDIEVGNGSFSLINGSGELLNPSYLIDFLSRSTRWRYVFPGPQTIGAGAQVVQEDLVGEVLVTDAPRPLTLFGEGVLLQTDSIATPTVLEEIILPKPKVNRIRYQESQWYSEIHLSNLPI